MTDELIKRLLPCPNPWCVPSARLPPTLKWSSEAFVECGSCGMQGPSVSPVVWNDDGEQVGTQDAEAEAISAWNTRLYDEVEGLKGKEEGEEGALPSDWATAAEPVVSVLRDGIPSAGLVALECLADQLFRHIEHGDEQHRAWLRDELRLFFGLVVSTVTEGHAPLLGAQKEKEG